ncbi:MAG TPA: OsmC family peroxiredoxin [Anaerolineae bacterium]|nr:OsmC family peroxiredoxin [Anaerolineae bacterium]
MPTRTAKAVWTGTLREGQGTMKLGSGPTAYEGAYTFASRFAEGQGTNPEELIGAAHAGCFSMFLSAVLTDAGYIPTRVQTAAKIHLGEGPKITAIELDCEAAVPNLDATTFLRYAEESKNKCPVSQALAGTEIKLTAKLVS